MTTVDITLKSSPSKDKIFGQIPIHQTLELYATGFTTLFTLINIKGSDNIVKQSTSEVSLKMKCEIDDLIKTTLSELENSKQLLKRKFPFRYKLYIIKTIIKNPFSFLIGLIFLKWQPK